MLRIRIPNRRYLKTLDAQTPLFKVAYNSIGQGFSLATLTIIWGKQRYTPKMPMASRIPSNFVFLFEVKGLNIIREHHESSGANTPFGTWCPPIQHTDFQSRPGTLFRWLGGTVTAVAPDDPARSMSRTPVGAATVFTHYPDSTHIIAVNVDAGMTDAADQSGSWRMLSFNHVASSNNRYFSSVNTMGQEKHLVAPGSQSWIRQLIPDIYDYSRQPSAPSRASAGLIGSVPILLALAVLSAPENLLIQTLTNHIGPGTWQRHAYGSDRESLVTLSITSTDFQKILSIVGW